MKGLHNNSLFLEAMVLADRGQYSSSLVIMKELYRTYEGNPSLNFFMGLAQLNLGEYASAEIFFRQALEFDKLNTHAYQGYGTTLSFLNRLDEAISVFDMAIKLAPDYPDIYQDKGLVYLKQKRYRDALCCFNKAIELDSKYVDAFKNQGVCLYELGHFEAAITSYDAAIEILADSQTFTNKGNALRALKLFNAAEVCYKAAINLNPDYADAYMNLAFLYLAQLKFYEGWKYYCWRLKTEDFSLVKIQTSRELWDGVANINSLFVMAEQGIGDQILFASIFDELQRVVPKITVSTDKKLLSIFRRSFPKINFVDKDYLPPEIDYDKHIALGSLAKFFRPDVASFKHGRFPYLIDDKSNVISSMPIFKNENIKCGISWKSLNQTIGYDKTIPLQGFREILNLNGIDFINLQYGGLTPKEQSIVNDELLTVFDDYDLYDDLDSLVSFIEACDIVVTISNSTAHLAGALGKDTLLLVPYSKGSIWYWEECMGRNLWYPNVKVFRQKSQGDWTQALSELKKYLEEKI